MNAYRELSPESHQLTEELLGESLSSAINQWSQSDPDDDLMTQLGILLWQSGLKSARAAVQGLESSASLDLIALCFLPC